MPEEKKDMLSNMPPSMKPSYAQGAPVVNPQKGKGGLGKKIVWGIIVIIGIILAVQYFNAAKYSALVQVIKEDKIGVNPTGEALDFGDLPHDKSAIRTVTLESKGNMASFIMIWKFGQIADLLKVSENNFTLQAHSTKKLEFSLYVPNSAEYRY